MKKVMATVFWNSEGVVLVDFVEGKKTCYRCLLHRSFREIEKKLAEKHPEKLHHGILFHYDNTTALVFFYSSRIVRDVFKDFW